MDMNFKKGDTFTLPIQFYNTDTQAGLTLTPNMQITAKIVDASRALIAEPTVRIDDDQLTNPGMILLEVPAAETALWHEGAAIMDIRLQVNDVVKHSQNIQFRIERSIT